MPEIKKNGLILAFIISLFILLLLFDLICLPLCFSESTTQKAYNKDELYKHWKNGVKYYKSKSWRYAAREFEECIEINPIPEKYLQISGTITIKYTPYLYLAQIYVHLGDLEKADKYLDKAKYYKVDSWSEISKIERIIKSEANTATPTRSPSRTPTPTYTKLPTKTPTRTPTRRPTSTPEKVFISKEQFVSGETEKLTLELSPTPFKVYEEEATATPTPQWFLSQKATVEQKETKVREEADKSYGSLINILSPKETSTQARMVYFSFALPPAKSVRHLKVLLNGRDISSEKIPSSSSEENEFGYQLTLEPGVNKVEISVLCGEKFEYKVLDLEYTPPYKELGLYKDLWVVIIGIDRYRNVRPLRNAVSDAKDVERAIRKYLRVREDRILTYYDEQATHDNLMDLFSSKLLQTDPEDGIIIFYSGHGYSHKTPGMPKPIGFIIPIDGSVDPKEIFTRNISMDDIKNRALAIPAKHILFVFDACFSGLFARKSITVQKPPETQDDKYLKGLVMDRLRQVLTAGDSDEEVPDVSVFHRYFVRALEPVGGADINRDGYITFLELASYIVEPVSRESERQPLWEKIEGQGEFVLPLKFGK